MKADMQRTGQAGFGLLDSGAGVLLSSVFGCIIMMPWPGTKVRVCRWSAEDGPGANQSRAVRGGSRAAFDIHAEANAASAGSLTSHSWTHLPR